MQVYENKDFLKIKKNYAFSLNYERIISLSFKNCFLNLDCNELIWIILWNEDRRMATEYKIILRPVFRGTSKTNLMLEKK